jgi:hypothetical protein
VHVIVAFDAIADTHLRSRIALAIPALIAVVLTASIAIAYVRRLLPRRRSEIIDSFASAGLVEYKRLFHPTSLETVKPEDCAREAFDATHATRLYVLPSILLVSAAACTAMVLAARVEAACDGDDVLVPCLRNMTAPMFAALAGALLWSLYEIIARVCMRSLDPDALNNLTLRLLGAIPIGLAFGSIVGAENLATFVAFGSAAFPLRETRVILRQWTANRMGAAPAVVNTASVRGRIDEILDGISESESLQLAENGFETFLDLAYADPIRLMARTGRPLRLILSWLDQALLAVYCPTNRTILSRWSIPCAMDAAEFYEEHFEPRDGKDPDWANDPAVKDLAENSAIPASLLKEAFRRVFEDPHVRFLRKAWRDGVRDP